MATTINFTKAITDGIINFEQACALQGVDLTTAIREGVLNFEEAQALSAMATKEATKPKAGKREKAATKATKAEEPKAEKPAKKEPVYTKGGLVIQYADAITARGAKKQAIEDAYELLTAQDFVVERKRVGTWVYIFRKSDGEGTYLDGRTWAEYRDAELPEGWIFVKGMWAYPELLANYKDSFKK